jgi:hypothetical protein
MNSRKAEEEAMIWVEMMAMDSGYGGVFAPRVFHAGELAFEVEVKVLRCMDLGVSGEEGGRVGEAKAVVEEEGSDAGVVLDWGGRGVDGGLCVWVRAILGVYVGFMLAYDVWPVVGVGEGVVGGGVWLARRDGAGGCELVRADMIEV